MPVVGENLGEAVFGGGGKVDRISGAEIGGGRSRGKDGFNPVEDRVGEGKPSQMSGLYLLSDLREK